LRGLLLLVVFIGLVQLGGSSVHLLLRLIFGTSRGFLCLTLLDFLALLLRFLSLDQLFLWLRLFLLVLP